MNRQRTADLLTWWIVPGGLVLAAAVYPLADPDMWWHLAAGRTILDGRFPLTNTLSHTFPDHPWRFTQWLFGTLIALAERAGGFTAVQFVVCAFAAGAFLLVMATVRREVLGAKWYLVLPLAAIGVLATRFRFSPRGDLATLLGLATVHYLWVARPKRVPLYLFLTACLWSNLHAGVVFGVLLIGLFGLAALLERDRDSIRDALYCGIAFCAGSLANRFLHYPYLYVLENLDIARHFPLTVHELVPPTWRDPPFATAAALGILGLIPALVRRRYRDILLIAGSGAMACSAIRFIPFLAVLSLPAVARSFHDYLESAAARRNPGAAGVLLSLPLVAVALWAGYVEARINPPGLGANFRTYPAGAADFILSRGFTGRMFNEFDHGGFLAWRLFPKHRVFIDGRGNAYPWSHFQQAAGYSWRTIGGVLDAYGVDHAVVQRRPGNIDWGSILSTLGWKLVHLEGSAFLFVRPGSPDASRAGADVFRVFVPGRNPDATRAAAQADPAQARSELLRIDPRSVLEAKEFNLLGACAYDAGDTGLAFRFLEAGLASFPAYHPLRLNYAAVLKSAGRPREAAEHYRRIVAAAPESDSAREAARRLGSFGSTPPPGTGAVR